MFDAEFTHEGDRCTFEVLLSRAGLERDPGLAAVAEIVHDIDMKDAKFGRPEAEGIRVLLAGSAQATTTRSASHAGRPSSKISIARSSGDEAKGAAGRF
jgi:hypothetical protein